jgi:hypothetical protein
MPMLPSTRLHMLVPDLMAVYDSPLNLCAPNTQLGLGKWAIAKNGAYVTEG